MLARVVSKWVWLGLMCPFLHLMENKIDVRPFQEHLLAPDFGVEHLPREVRDSMFTVPQ